MTRKKLVVVMNCQGKEIVRYLRSSVAISCQFDIIYISSIVVDDDAEAKRTALSLLSAAHVVVAQDVTSVHWLRNDYIEKIIPKYCMFFRFCFWRFYGFWPVSAEKFHPQMWYVCDELGHQDFRDYLAWPINASAIARNFEEQVDKFAYIERFSDLKMLPFFLDNYQRLKLFSDEWHPTSVFFYIVCCHILTELGFRVDIQLLPDDGHDNFRHRLVFNSVVEELGLQHDQNFINYHDRCLDRETFFNYCKFAERHYDRFITWLYPRQSFHEWCFSKNIDFSDVNISHLGSEHVIKPVSIRNYISGAKGEERDNFGDASRSIGREPASWCMDLRDFRKVSEINVSLDVVQADNPLSVKLLTSHDGSSWTEIAMLRLTPHSFDPEKPVRIMFDDPIYTRCVKLDCLDPDSATVRSADVIMRALVAE